MDPETVKATNTEFKQEFSATTDLIICTEKV